jgi:hypothetical protein
MGVGLTPRLGHSTPGNDPVTIVIGGWVGPRTNLDVLEKRKISISPAGIPTATAHSVAKSLMYVAA